MGFLQILTKAVKGLQLTQPTLFTGAIAHAGGGQANALQLQHSIVIIGTVATTADSVKLPNVLAENVPLRVVNNGANSCNVFPPTGGNLGSGVNTAYALAAGHTVEFLTSAPGNSTVPIYARIATYATT